MSQPHIKVKIGLGRIFDDGVLERRTDYAVGAAMTIIESAYVKEVPVNVSEPGFRGGIQVKKKGPLSYVVESTATQDGRNYPFYLFTGTGKLFGQPDFGYTSGRVRAGTVAYGIGGIRPNKAAQRAKDRSEHEFASKVRQLVSMALKQ